MLLHALMTATKIVDFLTHHLRALATTISHLKSQPSELYFISPSEMYIRSFLLDALTDGAMAAAGDIKGRGGHIFLVLEISFTLYIGHRVRLAVPLEVVV